MENMENLQVFENPEFGKLTVLTIDGEPWFIGSEVAELLGYQLTRKSVWSHVDPMDKNTVPIRNGNKRGNPNKVIINESGLYSLVMRSKIKSARKFQRWVTSEVLPSIRKHGAYMTREKILEVLREPESLITLLESLKEEQEKNAALTQRNQALDAENSVLAKAESAWSDAALLNRLVRKYASKTGGDFQFAWNTLYRKALYKYGINLRARQTASGGCGKLLSHLRAGELEKLLALAAAMCREKSVDISDCVGAENAKRIASCDPC